MNIEDFKKVAASYINRDSTLFATGGQDKLLMAVNMAKMWAQRTHRFERAKAMASLAITLQNGGSLTNAIVYGSTTNEAIIVRNIERAFLISSDGQGLFPIDLLTRDEQIQMLARSNENVWPEDRVPSVNDGRLVDVYLVRYGNSVNIWPWPTNLLSAGTGTIVLDIVQTLPEYEDDDDEDFFSTECMDWLLMRTLFYLNIFLKEDEKLTISHKVMDEAWQSVKDWDTSLVESTVPVTLD